MTEAEQTWAYIEKLLHDECGLRMDEGLEGQRANCINAIKNGVIAVIEQLEEVKALLKLAIDVFEGMNDDEITEDLLPHLREGLRPTRIGRHGR